MKTPLVSIQCIVYNHEPYLRQCLDGFVMQKTNFAFEAIVHDDASTDDSAEIIREYAEKYPDIIKPIYEEENQYSKKQPGLIGRIMTSAMSPSSKYIALCEGDDYWTDPYKLQKQVDALEAHPECSICFGQVMMVSKEGDKTPWLMPEKGIIEEGVCSLEDFTRLQFGKGYWVFHTSSFFYRKSILEGYQKALENGFGRFPYGDLPLILYSLTVGYGFYINELVSCYRLMSGGYNSMRLKDPEMDIKHGEIIIQGLKDFNSYTNFKYEKYIKRAIIRNQVGIDKLKHKSVLNIKYLQLLSLRSTILFVSKPLKLFFPTLYSKIKGFYWRLKSR